MPTQPATDEPVRSGLARPEAGQRALPRLGSRQLRREVVDQLRRALHRLRPGPVQPTSPAPAAGPTGGRSNWVAAPGSSCSTSSRPACWRGTRHRPVARHGRGGPAQRPNAGLRGRGPGRRRRVDPVPRRPLRPGGRARRAAPHPRRRAGAARGAAGAQARRPVRLRRRADPVRRLHRPPAVPADLVGHRPGHPAAGLAAWARPQGGAGRIVPGGRAGGGGRPAHLRSGRAARRWPAGPVRPRSRPAPTS